jgi:hypothetical protein
MINAVLHESSDIVDDALVEGITVPARRGEFVLKRLFENA